MGGFSFIENDPYGSVMNADNASFDGTPRGGVMTTNGQLWIGSTAAPHVRLGTPAINANGNLQFGAGAITINPYNTAKWIVDPISNIGTHTTIAGALAAASSGETIFIRPGTYTENITLKAGVYLSAFTCDAPVDSGHVIILGTVTATYTGTVTMSNIYFQTNGAVAISQAGSAATILNLYKCHIQATNANGITYSTSNASAVLSIRDSSINVAATFLPWAATSTGSMTLINTDITGASNALATITSTNLSMRYCRTFSNLSFTSASCRIEYTSFSNPNAINITTATSGTYVIYFCQFEAGANSAISIGASTTGVIIQNEINSAATNAITGGGTIQHSNNAFNSSSVINTTTQTALYTQLGKWKASGQPCFMATQNSAGTNNTGDNTVYTLGTTVDLTERFDQDSNFDPTTGVFTAPVTGRYHLSMGALVVGATTMTLYECNIVTTNKTYAAKMQNSALAVQQFGYPFSVICDMTAGDTATAAVFTTDGGGKIDDVYGEATKAYTYFCGFLVA